MNTRTMPQVERENNSLSGFSITNNSYVKEKLPDMARRIEVELGDTKDSGRFLPQYKTKHWDNECNFSLRLIDEDYDAGTVNVRDGVVEWSRAGRTARMYEKDAFGEDGGFEFEVELQEKPASNVLRFSIQAKEFRFLYQPELTQEEIDRGATRPENIVGSYAVYHRTKKNNRVDGKHYRTGKAFHIYRPHVKDATGTSVWAELSIDEQKQELAVTVPQEFLDKAVYPVIVDPTFGNTSIGGSVFSFGGINEINGQYATPSSDGTLDDKITFYCGSTTSTHNARCALYETSGNTSVTNFLGSTVEVAIPVDGDGQWVDFSMDDTPSVSNGVDYFLGIWCENASGQVGLWFDSGDTSTEEWRSITYTTNWPDPMGNMNSGTSEFSVYGTYSESGPSSVSIEKDLGYAVITTPTALTKDLGYEILTTPAATTKQLAYEIKSEQTLQKDLDYTVLTTPAAIEKGANYEVLTTPSATTKNLGYKVLTSTELEKGLGYAVKTTPSAVNKDLGYSVVTIPSIEKDLSYAVLTTPNATQKGLDYEVAPATQIQKNLDYTVLATPGALTKDLGYEILTHTEIEKATGYAIVASTSLEKDSTYEVVASATPLQKALSYEVITRATNQKDLDYLIITDSALMKGLDYAMVVTAEIEKALDYEILLATELEKTLDYEVTAAFSVEKDLNYAVQPASGVLKTLSYEVRAPLSNQKGLGYEIVVETALTKAVGYEVASPSTLTKGIDYQVTSTSPAMSKSVAYEVAVQSSIEKAVSYEVKAGTAIELTLHYTVPGDQQITKGLNYKVEREKSSKYPVVIAQRTGMSNQITMGGGFARSG